MESVIIGIGRKIALAGTSICLIGCPSPPSTKPVLSDGVGSAASSSPPVQVPSPQECFWNGEKKAATADEAAKDVAKLPLVSDMPYICSDFCRGGSGCGDQIFWQVVRDGMAAVPSLVELLDNPDVTTVDVPNIGGKYAVGDVALVALTEILRPVPRWQLAGISGNVERDAFTWFDYLRSDVAHRRTLKGNLEAWLEAKKPELIWHPQEGDSADAFGSVDCVSRCTHPAGGYFSVR